VDAAELLALGRARRALGHKRGDWTKEMNDRMIARMAGEGSLSVTEGDFASYFDRTLASEDAAFAATIVEFLDVAHSLKEKKEEGTWVNEYAESEEYISESEEYVSESDQWSAYEDDEQYTEAGEFVVEELESLQGIL